jgi:hypothetical protein
MINEDKKKLYDEDIEKFMPMLGTLSDKYIQKLQKINEKSPNFIVYIVAMLIDNKNLHNWTTTDLLEKSKSLIGEFKKSKHFKNAGGELKKFIKGEFTKSMNYIKIIATDLERLGFKKFWLEEKLPILKERISEYQEQLDAFDIVKYVNNWVVNEEKIGSNSWYVLAYSGNKFELLLEYFSVVSPVILADDLFERVVSYVLKTRDYKKFIRRFKPDASLKDEFNMHVDRNIYRKLNVYVEACLKMSMKVYLMENLSDMTVISLPKGYPFASETLRYLRENEKGASVGIQDYITNMMKHFSKK